MTDHPMEPALENWARIMESDIAAEVGKHPSPPPTSKQYRAENQSDDDTDAPPDEDWAIRVQVAMNTMRDYRPDMYRILYNRYRENFWTAPHVIRWALDVFRLYY